MAEFAFFRAEFRELSFFRSLLPGYGYQKVITAKWEILIGSMWCDGSILPGQEIAVITGFYCRACMLCLLNAFFVAKRQFSYQNVLFASHKSYMFNQLIVYKKDVKY